MVIMIFILNIKMFEVKSLLNICNALFCISFLIVEREFFRIGLVLVLGFLFKVFY